MPSNKEKRRIVFVADELLGYAGNGIGTTTTFVSLALARRGHRVEVLYAGPLVEQPVAEWQHLYDQTGVRVRQVAPGDESVEPGYFARARDVELTLRDDPPDVVVVQDLGAPAYTALRLRSLGLEFEQTSFVVFCHGTRQWITDVSRKVRVLPGAHAVSVLERASVELADAVVSPSAYLVDWMRGEGWQLPEQTHVIHHVSRAGATGESPPAPPQHANGIERLAFFGRLEERKGVGPFVGALNELEPELLGRIDVDFIGRPTPPWPVERINGLLSERTRAALRGLSFETALDQHEALARLRRPGTLAVMPSFEENSPNVIYECLENGIPFIASTAAGIRELVAPDDHARVLVAPTEDAIAAGLRRVLANGGSFRPARAAFDEEDSLRRWEEVLAQPARPFPPKGATEPGPDWSLSIGEHDVPESELIETLVRAQEVSSADVVTCGLFVDGRVHLFPGEPRALGLLSNGYGTVALIRRSSLDPSEPAWTGLARLSVSGAKIVSVPRPLVTQAEPPATLATHPDEGLLVLKHFERALPPNLRYTAELAARQAAQVAVPPRRRRFMRRALGRLRRSLRR